MTWRERFNMSGPPLPRDAAGETFFDQGPHFQRLARVFAWLTAEPGIGVVTGEPGVGKTSAMRHLCRALPLHEHRVVYLGDTTVKPLDLYRMLATELGLRPSPRAQIVGRMSAGAYHQRRLRMKGRAHLRPGGELTPADAYPTAALGVTA